MTWIPKPVTLTGEYVELIPMAREHFPALDALAKEQSIWKFYIYDLSNSEKLLETLESALEERGKGTQVPYVIRHKSQKKIIGATRLMEIVPVHRKLEIGWTWLHPDYWASVVNPECKLLLLTYCFEELKTIRVQLRTDENNARSRKAIEKIGGKFEAIVDHDMLRGNGTKRNSAYYRILDHEWSGVKEKLLALVNRTSGK